MGTLVLALGEYRALGAARVGVAIALLAVAAVPAIPTLALLHRPGAPPWLLPTTLLGTASIALLSGILVPPGSLVPPPLLPIVIAAAICVALQGGAVHGLGAGSLAAGVPLVTTALSVSELTADVAGVVTALVLASVALPVLAGFLTDAVPVPAPPAVIDGATRSDLATPQPEHDPAAESFP